MLFGVAGGMADWLDLDSSLVRIVWAILILAGGVGLLLYIIAAIVIPEEPLGGPVRTSPVAGDAAAAASGADPTAAAVGDDWRARREARRAARAQRNGNGAVIFGVILVALGAWFLIDRYLNVDSALVVPAVLIVLGAGLVVLALGRSRNR
jgi:phage shock protein C